MNKSNTTNKDRTGSGPKALNLTTKFDMLELSAIAMITLSKIYIQKKTQK